VTGEKVNVVFPVRSETLRIAMVLEIRKKTA